MFIVNSDVAEAENYNLRNFYTTNDTDCPAVDYRILIELAPNEVLPTQQQLFNHKIYEPENDPLKYIQIYP
jgi:hypothetical protein